MIIRQVRKQWLEPKTCYYGDDDDDGDMVIMAPSSSSSMLQTMDDNDGFRHYSRPTPFIAQKPAWGHPRHQNKTKHPTLLYSLPGIANRGDYRIRGKLSFEH